MSRALIAIAHYAPAEHALEVRARLTPHIWRALREGVALNAGDGLPEGTILVGLTSLMFLRGYQRDLPDRASCDAFPAVSQYYEKNNISA